MPEGCRFSAQLPDWLRLSIADAVIVFGRMEQEVVEITWVMQDADLKKRLKLARNPATENFIDAIEGIERISDAQFDALKDEFKRLADERNLIVHGAWAMVDERPWVVWHKFIEDTESIVGEWFDQSRFQRSMLTAEHLLNTLRLFHDEIEKTTGTRTSAMPRS